MATLRTVLSIIEDAVSDGLGLPRSPIANDILAEAISRYNRIGQDTFDVFPFDAKKIDPFLTTNNTYVTSFTAGIITFKAPVDLVRAVRPSVDGATGVALWPQDDIDAAFRTGADVDSQRFIYMADGADGVKRIKVNDEDDTTVYSILATARFVRATIESAYSSGSPSATPTDYRVLTWPLHHALPALIARLSDELRVWDGQRPTGDWTAMLQTAVNKTTRQEARETVVMPADPMFGEGGSWQDGNTYN